MGDYVSSWSDAGKFVLTRLLVYASGDKWKTTRVVGGADRIRFDAQSKTRT